MGNTKQGRKLQPDWKRIGLGAGAGVLALLTMTALAAGAISRELTPLEGLRWWAVGALLLAGAVAGRTGGTVLDGALAGLGVAVVLLGLNVALFDGKMEGFAASALALFGGCGAALLWPRRKGRASAGRRRRKIVKLPKRHYR